MNDNNLPIPSRIKPFLRWAGGKTKFVNEIIDRLPKLSDKAIYYEPFLGAGSVFFAYSPSHAVISDLNPALIKTFKSIKKDYASVYKHLRNIFKNDSECNYYTIREKFNKGGSDFLQAARFIYLNQTSFNGIFRVNMQGKYNVPYGYKNKPRLPQKNEFEAVSKLLQRTTILLADYKKVLPNAVSGDVVYLDPPYPPLNGTSYFTHYTKERFALDDQISVANVANSLREKGCTVIVTNADTDKIRELYLDWNCHEISRPRWISSSSHKHRVVELIFTSH